MWGMLKGIICEHKSLIKDCSEPVSIYTYQLKTKNNLLNFFKWLKINTAIFFLGIEI